MYSEATAHGNDTDVPVGKGAEAKRKRRDECSIPIRSYPGDTVSTKDDVVDKSDTKGDYSLRKRTIVNSMRSSGRCKVMVSTSHCSTGSVEKTTK